MLSFLLKKLGLILITLILAAGMVFAVESTVNVTGTIVPGTPEIEDDDPVAGDDKGGLWIYSYVQALDSDQNIGNGPGAYNSADNKKLEENPEIPVNVMHDEKASGAEALYIVYGVSCDVPADYAKPPVYTIAIDAPTYFDLVTGTAGGVATTKDDDTFSLTTSTSLSATEIALDDSSDNDAKLSLDTFSLTTSTSLSATEIALDDSSDNDAKLSLEKTDNVIKITTAAGLSNRSAKTPQLVGWTAVTWAVTDKTPVAGTYTADITITIASV